MAAFFFSNAPGAGAAGTLRSSPIPPVALTAAPGVAAAISVAATLRIGRSCLGLHRVRVSCPTVRPVLVKKCSVTLP